MSKEQPAATWEAIDSLTPWAKNPRHNSAAVADLAKSIQRFGFGAPIVARTSDRVIIAGHTRLLAAQSLNMDKVPVRFLDLDPDQAAALALADNKLGEIADWDDDLLAGVLRELEAAQVDLDGLGWDDEALSALLGDAGEDQGSGEEGEPQELDKGPAHSVQGTIYQLGPHRLMCGDCRDPDVVSALMAGDVVNVAFTSPPYASQRTYDESSGFKPIPPDEYVDWFDAVQSSVRAHLAEDGSWFINITEAAYRGCKFDYVKRLTLQHIDQWNWKWIEEYCWQRPAMPTDPNTGRRFKNGWESVFHFSESVAFRFSPNNVRHPTSRAFKYKDQKAAGKSVTSSAQGDGGNVMGPEHAGEGLAFPSNVLSNMGGANVVGHSAAFPVGLPEFFIKAFSDPEDLIYDPFTGSGTTLIAAAQNGRRFVGCEISPGYCDLIRRRWTAYADKNNLDAGTGSLPPLPAV